MKEKILRMVVALVALTALWAAAPSCHRGIDSPLVGTWREDGSTDTRYVDWMFKDTGAYYCRSIDGKNEKYTQGIFSYYQGVLKLNITDGVQAREESYAVSDLTATKLVVTDRESGKRRSFTKQ